MTTTTAKAVNPNEAKPALGLGKPAPEAKISLKAICSEMKLDTCDTSCKRRRWQQAPTDLPRVFTRCTRPP